MRLPICPTGRPARISVKPCMREYSSFQKFGFAVWSRHPASIAEGRIAIVTTREAGCGGRDMPTDERHRRGRSSRVVLARPCRRQVGRDVNASWPAAVANKLVHRGEREVSRKPLRREGRSVSACTCGHAPFAQFFWREGPGCSGHPVFPAPSHSERAKSLAKLGRDRAARRRIRIKRRLRSLRPAIRSAILTLFGVAARGISRLEEPRSQFRQRTVNGFGRRFLGSKGSGNADSQRN
jgi:hypothetical protein